MAKADRLERMEIRLAELEAEYTAAFVEALRVTASGKWGLFDHQRDKAIRKATAPTLDHLEELAAAIDKARDQLSLPPFALHAQFLAARGPVRSDAVGEPKQAQAWLDRLSAGADSAGA